MVETYAGRRDCAATILLNSYRRIGRTLGGAATAVAYDVLFWRATRHTHGSKLAGRRRAAVPGRSGYARTRTFFSYSADHRPRRRDPPRRRGDPKTVDPPERTLSPARAPGSPRAATQCYFFHAIHFYFFFFIPIRFIFFLALMIVVR